LYTITNFLSFTVNLTSPGHPRFRIRRSAYQGLNIGQERIAPPEHSENRWVPQFLSNPFPKITQDFIPLNMVQRKINALLNKLTLEKFGSISDQIIHYANKSRGERDGRIIKEVVRLIFERSCDETKFSAIYAQLCCNMKERIDPEIVDENFKNTEGKFVRGDELFKKYLLKHCQEEFGKDYKVYHPFTSNDKEERDLYNAAAKAKRRALGLMRFIGELLKQYMITESAIRGCIKKLIFKTCLKKKKWKDYIY
jgi:translation initiation factor 4G